VSELSEMKPNLVDRTCKLLKWLCNYRKLHKKTTREQLWWYSLLLHSSDVVKWSSRGSCIEVAMKQCDMDVHSQPAWHCRIYWWLKDTAVTFHFNQYIRFGCTQPDIALADRVAMLQYHMNCHVIVRIN